MVEKKKPKQIIEPNNKTSFRTSRSLSLNTSSRLITQRTDQQQQQKTRLIRVIDIDKQQKNKVVECDNFQLSALGSNIINRLRSIEFSLFYGAGICQAEKSLRPAYFVQCCVNRHHWQVVIYFKHQTKTANAERWKNTKKRIKSNQKIKPPLSPRASGDSFMSLNQNGNFFLFFNHLTIFRS